MTSAQAGIVLRHIRGLAARQPAAQVPDGQLLERFTNSNDTTAFEALLDRHGAMVLGVCRRLLRDANDVEDAFQATFCILAQKACSVRRQESVAGWLYQVACNAALKARARAATRQRHERQAGSRPPADPLNELTGRELLTALDEELHRIPERLRAPLVLCYLEGRTRDEAARELGLALGTLKHRLEEGKAALRSACRAADWPCRQRCWHRSRPRRRCRPNWRPRRHKQRPGRWFRQRWRHWFATHCEQ